MIYSKNDIQSFYTNQIKKYLQDGYDINIESMNGSQGEDSRIDLVKDGEVIRVILDKRYEIRISDIIYIQIIRFKYDGSTIYWNNRGEVVKTFNFLKTRDRKNFYMVEGDEEVNKIIEKRKTRDRIKSHLTPDKELDSKYYSTFKKIIQTFDRPGWKRFDITNVITWKSYNGRWWYRITKKDGSTFDLERSRTKFF